MLFIIYDVNTSHTMATVEDEQSHWKRKEKAP